MSISSTQEIVAELRAGRMVILVDEEDRENEGDLVLATDFVTPEAINFMVKHARGLVCLSLTQERCRQLSLPLMVSDFRNFILDDDLLYDGIAIDVGGPDFRFGDEFDVETCDAIRARLAPGGRIIMNVLVANDIDPIPDRIAARLAGDRLAAWIVDEQGVQDRNAIIACVPEKQLNARPALAEVMQNSLERWSIRRGRLRGRDPGATYSTADR